MGEEKELSFADFKDVTEHIYLAVDKIDTLYKSLELTEYQRSELRRIGKLLHAMSHDIGHLYVELESLPKTLRDELEDYYGHGH